MGTYSEIINNAIFTLDSAQTKLSNLSAYYDSQNKVPSTNDGDLSATNILAALDNVATINKDNSTNTVTETSECISGKVAYRGDIGDSISVSGSTISIPAGYYNASSVYNAIPAPNLITKNITTNGTYAASGDNADGYSSVEVSVAAVSKLPQVVDRSVTSIDAADLQGITKIGDYAFYECTQLTSVTIPSGVTSIGNYAFKGCSSLNQPTIPSSVISIGTSAFSNCSGLTSFTIPSSVISIGTSAFGSCSGLTSITIPSSVTSIGSSAFQYSGLTSIIIPDTVTTFGSTVLSNCTSLTNATITPRQGYGESLFANCVNLTTITLGTGSTIISGGMFSNCPKLTSVTIPNGITTIGKQAFTNCYKITSMTFPSSVTNIGSQVFYCRTYSSWLTTVTILATTPPTLASTDAFPSSVTTYYIPNGTLSAYQTASNWSKFSAKFVELPA